MKKEEKVVYKVYSVKYERLKENNEKEKIFEDFYLKEEERDYVFENGTSKIFINIFPAKAKSLFHAWNIPKCCIKTKHTYICEEPNEKEKKKRKLTAEDYKIKEIGYIQENLYKIIDKPVNQ